MNKEWIEDWREEIGLQGEYEGQSVEGMLKYIPMHGSTSTSKSMDVALGFSKCGTKYDDNKQAVLFVYSIYNYGGFNGFRLNDKKYSVYPGEQEYLLMEGF